jgi:hypothetical protein
MSNLNAPSGKLNLRGLTALGQSPNRNLNLVAFANPANLNLGDGSLNLRGLLASPPLPAVETVVSWWQFIDGTGIDETANHDLQIGGLYAVNDSTVGLCSEALSSTFSQRVLQAWNPYPFMGFRHWKITAKLTCLDNASSFGFYTDVFQIWTETLPSDEYFVKVLVPISFLGDGVVRVISTPAMVNGAWTFLSIEHHPAENRIIVTANENQIIEDDITYSNEPDDYFNVSVRVTGFGVSQARIKDFKLIYLD